MEATAKKNDGIFAVSNNEFKQFGCPTCGGIFGSSNLSGNGAAIWNCSDCNNTCIILADGVQISPFGIGDIYPELQEHPRRGQFVDREKVIKDRELKIQNDEKADLDKWLEFGYGTSYSSKIISEHSSKSRKLPILSATCNHQSNLEITWFAQNYYFYFLGVKFKKPVYATLLSPISNIFGAYALSGHVNTSVAPQIRNFEKAYHLQDKITHFGVDAGNGFTSALVIRYLHMASSLNTEKILDVCLRQTRYGHMETIDANAIELTDMISAVKLDEIGKENSYDFSIELHDCALIKKIIIDQFDSDLGGSSVHISLKQDMLLPELPISSKSIYVDPLDTPLSGYLPKEVQGHRPRDYSSPVLLKKISPYLFNYKKKTKEERIRLSSCPYPVNSCYVGTQTDTREFTINAKNILDATLIAFFLVNVLEPVIKMMLSKK